MLFKSAILDILNTNVNVLTRDPNNADDRGEVVRVARLALRPLP